MGKGSAQDSGFGGRGTCPGPQTSHKPLHSHAQLQVRLLASRGCAAAGGPSVDFRNTPSTCDFGWGQPWVRLRGFPSVCQWGALYSAQPQCYPRRDAQAHEAMSAVETAHTHFPPSRHWEELRRLQGVPPSPSHDLDSEFGRQLDPRMGSELRRRAAASPLVPGGQLLCPRTASGPLEVPASCLP